MVDKEKDKEHHISFCSSPKSYAPLHKQSSENIVTLRAKG